MSLSHGRLIWVFVHLQMRLSQSLSSMYTLSSSMLQQLCVMMVDDWLLFKHHIHTLSISQEEEWHGCIDIVKYPSPFLLWWMPLSRSAHPLVGAMRVGGVSPPSALDRSNFTTWDLSDGWCVHRLSEVTLFYLSDLWYVELVIRWVRPQAK